MDGPTNVKLEYFNRYNGYVTVWASRDSKFDSWQGVCPKSGVDTPTYSATIGRSLRGGCLVGV